MTAIAFLCGMKRIFFLMLFSCGVAAVAQVDSTTPPYKKFPTLPPIQLLLSDSATKYGKENVPKTKSVWVILFSPECNHCKQTAEELVKYKEELKDIHIVMASMYSIKQIKDFEQTYGLAQLPNVVVGKDIYFLIPPFYDVKTLPFMAFYNKKGNLISVFEGSMPAAKVIQIFKESK